MAGIVEPIPVQDWGRTIRDAFGVYQGIKGEQRQSAQQERQKEIDDLSARAYSDPVAYKKLKGLDPQRAAQIQQMGNVDLDRFHKERGQTALEINGLPKENQLQILGNRIKTIESRGGDPSNTQRLYSMVEEDNPEVQKVINNVLEQSYQSDYLKRPPQEKVDLTTLQKNLAAAGIVPGSDQYKNAILASTKGQTINLNTGEGPGKVGTIPPGYAARINKQTGQYEMYEIKGGPAEKKTADEKKAENLKAESTGKIADLVQEDIGRLKTLVERQKWYNPVTGMTAEYIFDNIPGTARKDAEALRTTIATNIGFDRLQKMRDESPTGGALGQVSEQEMKQLMATMGNIDLNQSDSQIIYNLKRMDAIYTKILAKARAYPTAEKYGFGGARPIPVSQQEAASEVNQMPEEVKRRYY